jgi:Zn-dependent protease
MPEQYPSLAEILAFTLPLLVAMTVHEVAHAIVARTLGDRTAAEQGRVSLNPFRHIDWLGTVLVPAVLILVRAPIPIGWARPVPVDVTRLGHPRRDMVLVALAGPVANLALAVVSIGLLAWSDPAPDNLTLFDKILSFSVFANTAIGLFNLVPLPPLDGGRIMLGILPEMAARRYARLAPLISIGLILALILTPLVLMVTGDATNLLEDIVKPAARALIGFVEMITGTPMVWTWT